jgi:hypothetical protein
MIIIVFNIIIIKLTLLRLIIKIKKIEIIIFHKNYHHLQQGTINNYQINNYHNISKKFLIIHHMVQFYRII